MDSSLQASVALSLGLPCLMVALEAVVVRLGGGRRIDGIRLRGQDGLWEAWLGLGFAIITIVLATLVQRTNAGWACPGLPGCTTTTFWPREWYAGLHMAYRAAVVISALVIIYAAGKGSQPYQARLVRATAAVTTVAVLLNVALLVGMILASGWDHFPALHLLVGTLLIGSSGALPLVLGRFGQPSPASATTPSVAVAPQSFGQLVRIYVALTKPRIISLLLLTTLGAMLMAVDRNHPISFALVLWTMVGGYLAAGGANAINMYLDRDVDALMGRTSRRPLPSSRLNPANALRFGLILNVLAFIVLTWSSNLLAASLAIAGSAFYVLIYTRILKRSTVQNIVVGGAAGAIPPLVGWAAVTGEISLAPLLLFAIIFYWTPPHFWALALLRRADYARAGIPMLPVARGASETKAQILLYSFLLVAISILPAPLRMTGPLYLLLALLLGLRFLQFAYRLFREPGTTNAWPLYKYSLMYLALLFAALVVDHLVMLSLA